MFGTTLTDEYLRISNTFGFTREHIKQFVLNGVRSSLLPTIAQQSLERSFRAQFVELETELGL
jgi:hypothetical protein